MATVASAGVIVLQLRSLLDDVTIAEGLFSYLPGDPGYAMVSRRIGRISIGETVFVRPFPRQGREQRVQKK